jgi:hypothetical protein
MWQALVATSFLSIIWCYESPYVCLLFFVSLFFIFWLYFCLFLLQFSALTFYVEFFPKFSGDLDFDVFYLHSHYNFHKE